MKALAAMAVVWIGCAEASSASPVALLSSELVVRADAAREATNAVHIEEDDFAESFANARARARGHRDVALALYANACSLGNRRACIGAMALKADRGETSAVALVVAHCLRGDTAACRALPPYRVASQPVSDAECRDGNVNACSVLSPFCTHWGGPICMTAEAEQFSAGRDDGGLRSYYLRCLLHDDACQTLVEQFGRQNLGPLPRVLAERCDDGTLRCPANVAALVKAMHAFAVVRTVDYSRPFDRERFRREQANADALLVEACRIGNVAACVSAFSLREPDLDERVLVSRNCDRGDVQSCEVSADPFHRTEGTSDTCAVERTCMPVVLRRECELGYRASCRLLVERYHDREARERLRRARARRCRLGASADCASPDELAENCQAWGGMFCLPQPDERRYFCRTWGNAHCLDIAYEELARGNRIAARDLFELACKLDDEACKSLLLKYRLGVFSEPVPGRTEVVYEYVRALL